MLTFDVVNYAILMQTFKDNLVFLFILFFLIHFPKPQNNLKYFQKCLTCSEGQTNVTGFFHYHRHFSLLSCFLLLLYSAPILCYQSLIFLFFITSVSYSPLLGELSFVFNVFSIGHRISLLKTTAVCLQLCLAWILFPLSSVSFLNFKSECLLEKALYLSCTWIYLFFFTFWQSEHLRKQSTI